MAERAEKKRRKPNKGKEPDWGSILVILSVIEGCWSTATIFKIPSEAENAVLLGYSAERLAIAAICILGILFLIGFFLFRKRKRYSVMMRQIIFGGCVLIFTLCALIFLLNYNDIGRYDTLIPSLISRYGWLFVWGILFGIEIGVTVVIDSKRNDGELKRLFTPLYEAVLFGMAAVLFILAFEYYDRVDWTRHLGHIRAIFLAPVAIAILWAISVELIKGKETKSKVNTIWLFLMIASLAFAGYRLTGFWVYRTDTPPKSYWDLLANAFLNGQLYLNNPPTTHDLTMYNGKWYVPNPPLPAILLMPFVKWFGVEGINMTVVSAIIGALNTALIFLILHRAVQIGMIRCERSAILWLTVVFAFGTNHVWLAVTGQMWFISQLITVTMIELSVLAVISKWSGWLVGLFFGFATLARPNIFPIAFLLLGIYLWEQADFPKVDWRKTINWGIKTAFPVMICICLLLSYNKLRFDDWFDFGYVTINGAPWILEAVQKYGMFHPHFFKTNLRVMLWQLPTLDFSGDRFFFQPGISGFSIFVMTPPLIYLFRRFRKNWWVVGAWASVILTILLLLLYHNTGAEQVGYRYLLDAIVPIMLLMGLGVDRKVNWFFKMLAMIGIAVNLLSVYWWFIART